MISQTLDLLISMVFIIFLASLLLSAFYELIASWINARGKMLYFSIKDVFSESNVNQLVGFIYSNPVIHVLSQQRNYPSYIPGDHFSKTTLKSLIDLEKSRTNTYSYHNGIATIHSPYTAQQLQDNNFMLSMTLQNMEPSNIKTILETASINPGHPNYFDELEKYLNKWYDDYQDRVGGWYKRQVQRHSFWIAFIFCVLMNFNLINIYKEVRNNIPLQKAAIAMAESYSNENMPTMDPERFKSDITLLQSYNFPFGYKLSNILMFEIHQEGFIKAFLSKPRVFLQEIFTMNLSFMNFLGWIISALLLTVQSSFWFNLMTSLLNIRKSGNKPISSSSTTPEL